MALSLIINKIVQQRRILHMLKNEIEEEHLDEKKRQQRLADEWGYDEGDQFESDEMGRQQQHARIPRVPPPVTDGKARIFFTRLQRQAIRITWRKMSDKAHQGRTIQMLVDIFEKLSLHKSVRAMYSSQSIMALMGGAAADSSDSDANSLDGSSTDPCSAAAASSSTTPQPQRKVVRSRLDSCKVHGRYLYALMDKFVWSLSPRDLANGYRLTDLEEIGAAHRHVCKFGFRPALFEKFAEHLIDVFLMHDIVQNCPEAKHAWMLFFAYFIDSLRAEFERSMCLKQRRSKSLSGRHKSANGAATDQTISNSTATNITSASILKASLPFIPCDRGRIRFRDMTINDDEKRHSECEDDQCDLDETGNFEVGDKVNGDACAEGIKEETSADNDVKSPQLQCKSGNTTEPDSRPASICLTTPNSPTNSYIHSSIAGMSAAAATCNGNGTDQRLPVARPQPPPSQAAAVFRCPVAAVVEMPVKPYAHRKLKVDKHGSPARVQKQRRLLDQQRSRGSDAWSTRAIACGDIDSPTSSLSSSASRGDPPPQLLRRHAHQRHGGRSVRRLHSQTVPLGRSNTLPVLSDKNKLRLALGMPIAAERQAAQPLDDDEHDYVNFCLPHNSAACLERLPGASPGPCERPCQGLGLPPGNEPSVQCDRARSFGSAGQCLVYRNECVDRHECCGTFCMRGVTFSVKNATAVDRRHCPHLSAETMNVSCV